MKTHLIQQTFTSRNLEAKNKPAIKIQDNRPLFQAQSKLIQMMEPKVDPWGRTRASQRPPSILPPTTSGMRTRSADIPTSLRSYKPVVPCFSFGINEEGDRVRLWKQGDNRPSFSSETEAVLYSAPREVDGKKLFECLTFGGTAWLPRKGDRSGKEDYATIGHIKQWQDFVASRYEPGVYKTEKGDRFRAYSRDEVIAGFNDLSNLQLEGQSFNSSKAEDYITEDYPLTQQWIT